MDAGSGEGSEVLGLVWAAVGELDWGGVGLWWGCSGAPGIDKGWPVREGREFRYRRHSVVIGHWGRGGVEVIRGLSGVRSGTGGDVVEGGDASGGG